MKKHHLLLPYVLAALLVSGCAESRFYSQTPVGEIKGHPHLIWSRPDQFRFNQPGPGEGEKFAFVTHDCWRIEPRPMSTDGASIPRWLWWDKEMSPWRYAPAAVIHDWLFDVHHRLVRNPNFLEESHFSREDIERYKRMTYEEAADIYAEAMKTLMERKKLWYEPRKFTLWAQHAATSSPIARELWNKQPGTEDFRHALKAARRRESQWPEKPSEKPNPTETTGQTR